MRFTTTYPLIAHPYNPDFVTKSGLVRVVQACERAGFDGFGVTDHPAPTHRWLQAGGHDALDPFAALAFAAAVTERIRLIPNILVLPYRNPFLVAKAVATIDALSGGRFTLAVATGYLRGEYAALGVDFDERNSRFDEALEVVRGAWSTDDFTFAGRHFSARGQTANPKPGPVPVWIGGNSALTRRRVAAVADGWAPFPAARQLATTAKTPVLENLDDLSAMLDDLRRQLDLVDRDPAGIDVALGRFGAIQPGSAGFDADAELTGLAEMAALGVTWSTVSLPGDSVDHAVEAIEQYGAEVIGPLRR